MAACIPPPRENKPLPDIASGSSGGAGTDATDGGAEDTGDKDAGGDTGSSGGGGDTGSSGGTDAVELPKGCTANTDCADKPAKVCRVWQCDTKTGKCSKQANAKATTPCEDGDKCTTGEKCNFGGACVGGKQAKCDDGNTCTQDSCNKLAGGCINNPNDTLPCTDGDMCTTDACTKGNCAHKAVKCNDDDVCTTDSCDSGTKDKPGKGCLYDAAKNGTKCDDGKACTKHDSCSNKVCSGAPMSAADCNDGEPCTLDSCPPLGEGCLHIPLAGEQDACKDGNECIEKAKCSAGKCVIVSKKECTGGSACFVMKCDPKLGQCKGEDLENGKDCVDAKKCIAGICADGGCKKVTEPDCDDSNACTLDKCTKGEGCTHKPLTSACNDGSACTKDDACKDSKCTGTPTIDCNDSNECTVDTCDPLTGKCSNTNAKDGTACAGGKTCSAGKCG